MLTLWLYREGEAVRLCPRPDGAPPPYDDATKVAEGLSVDEYEQITESAAAQLAAEHGMEIQHARPAIITLAALHAELHWTRKKRNADLRRWGYDPDGEDGKRYRVFFDREIYKAKTGGIISKAKETLPLSAPVVLWLPPAGEHNKAQQAGLIDTAVSREEYIQRLTQTERQVRAAELRPVRVEAGVKDVLEIMRTNNLPNTTQGRITAFTLLWAKNENKNTD